jgi:outer membrane protein
MKPVISCTCLLFCMLFHMQLAAAQNVITLSWNDVVEISQNQNLEIKIQQNSYYAQRLSEWQAISDFLPTVNYQFQATNNFELPVFVFMGQRIQVGSKFNFQHSFVVQYPIFVGGLRWANWQIQKKLRKSMAQELKGKEDEVVFKALEVYFTLMLANTLIDVNQRAYEAAKANFEQVEKFYTVGAASKLDYLRAKSSYSSSLPPLTSAKNAQKLAEENLKYILNVTSDDSLVILDTLTRIDFLKDYNTMTLPDLQEMSLQERPDLKSIELQREVTAHQKTISLSNFLPALLFTAGLQHQAQLNTSHVSPKDYIRSKYAALTLQIPLFQGAQRIFDYQRTRVNDRKAELQLELFRNSLLLDVENNYNLTKEANANLSTLKQAQDEAKEALRLANLNYREGIITQVDVLAAHLALTNSEVRYQQGLYNYNISQLSLLKSIGKLTTIWSLE